MKSKKLKLKDILKLPKKIALLRRYLYYTIVNRVVFSQSILSSSERVLIILISINCSKIPHTLSGDHKLT